MKKKIILGRVIILAMIFQNVNAQVVSLDWQQNSYPTVCAYGGQSVELDNAGNIYVSGGIQDGLLAVGGCTNLAKLSSDGNVIWTIPFQSEIPEIKIKVINSSVYVTGILGNSIVDMDPDSNNVYNVDPANGQIFLAKYNLSGNLIWAESFGSATYGITNQPLSLVKSITLDNNENIYLGGVFTGTVDFDPSPAVNSLSALNNVNANGFFAKYNSSGSFVFANQIRSVLFPDGNYGTNGIRSVSVIGNSLLVCGYFSLKADFNPSVNNDFLTATANGTTPLQAGFFAKYDLSGTYIFAKAIKANSTEYWMADCFDVTADANQIYLCGEFGDTIDFNPGGAINKLISNGQPGDDFIACYDNAGNYQWAKKTYSGAGADRAFSIAADGLGNVYVVGAAGNYKETNFFAKYNSVGTMIFKYIDYIFGYPGEIIADNSGDFLITGRTCYFQSATYNDFDFSPGLNQIDPAAFVSGSSRPAYLVKYHECSTCATPVTTVSNITSSSAKINWSLIDCAYKYQIKYWVAGSSTTTKNVYDPTVTKKLTGLSPSTTYQYQIRTQCDNSGYSPYSTIQTFTTNALREGDNELLNTENEITSLNISPNPVNNELTVSFQSEAQNVNLQIINSTGQVIYNSTSDVEDGNFNQTIDVSNLQSGIYLFRVFDKNNFASKRFVKL